MSVSSSATGLLGTYPYSMLAALFFSAILFRSWQLKKGRDGNPNGLPLPPGPKFHPLIGNLFNMPVDKPWVGFDEWRKTHGKIFINNGLSPQITGHFRWYDIPQYPCQWPAHFNFKFVGSHQRLVWETVFKLLRRKTNDYIMMLNKLYVSHSFDLKELVKTEVRCGRMDGSIIMSFMPYSLKWRKHRRLFHKYFHRDASTKYQPIQRQEAQAFLRRLLVTPDTFFHHIRQ